MHDAVWTMSTSNHAPARSQPPSLTNTPTHHPQPQTHRHRNILHHTPPRQRRKQTYSIPEPTSSSAPKESTPKTTPQPLLSHRVQLPPLLPPYPHHVLPPTPRIQTPKAPPPPTNPNPHPHPHPPTSRPYTPSPPPPHPPNAPHTSNPKPTPYKHPSPALSPTAPIRPNLGTQNEYPITTPPLSPPIQTHHPSKPTIFLPLTLNIYISPSFPSHRRSHTSSRPLNSEDLGSTRWICKVARGPVVGR